MNQTQLPIPRAYSALFDVSRGVFTSEKAKRFALTWIAAAKMISLGTVVDVHSLGDLAHEGCWESLSKAGLPTHDAGVSMTDTKNGATNLAVIASAVEIVKTLHAELGANQWDILPTITAGSLKNRDESSSEIITPVAELLFDLLPVEKTTVWIPFDQTGTLTIRALRRGWNVCAAQMLGTDNSTLKILLAIETGRPAIPEVWVEIGRDSEGRPTTQAEYAIVNPPFGVALRDSRLGQWSTVASKDFHYYDRTECMVISEVLKRISRRAVFLVPQGVLFNGGQEMRLRETIIHRGGECNDLYSVIALPKGAITGTSLATAILAIGDVNDECVRMVDLGSTKRTSADISEMVTNGRDAALGLVTDDARACIVRRQDIMDNECVFAPSRYLSKKIDVGPNAVPLGDLCEVIRPPVLSKDERDDELFEAGIPELGPWMRLNGPFVKTIKVRGRGRGPSTLESDDILLSVKGSVGRVGLMGNDVEGRVVPSQSCIGLRQKPGHASISPEYLLMYLRSESGQAQIDALKVGATVQHVNVSTVLESVLIPISDGPKQRQVEESYFSLCKHEVDIAISQTAIEEISREHWAVD